MSDKVYAYLIISIHSVYAHNVCITHIVSGRTHNMCAAKQFSFSYFSIE